MHLDTPGRIAATGSYEFKVLPGVPHLFTLKGTYGGTSGQFKAMNPLTRQYENVDNGTTTGTKTEFIITPPEQCFDMQIVLTGGSGIDLTATCGPITNFMAASPNKNTA